MPARSALLAGALLLGLLLLITAVSTAVISILSGGLLGSGGNGGPQSGAGYGPVKCRIGGGIHGAGVNLDATQAGNAAVINQVALDDGLEPVDRAAVIALAAALQESGLENLDHGDRDSLGLFQQRPSQGWGTPAQIMNPAYAANRFYVRLQRVRGWWSLPVWQAAQAVQDSAFPTAYQQWQNPAESIQQFLAGHPNACSVTKPDT